MRTFLLSSDRKAGRARIEAAISFVAVVATLGFAVVCGLMLAPLLHGVWFGGG